MNVSVAAPTRVTPRAAAVQPWTIYTAALAFWLVTRALVLLHQGAWPWMNAFVVAAARGIVVGDWNEAVRPQLPAVLGVPLVLSGATEQQMVAALYVLASLVQFWAFVAFLRTVYPGRLQEQTLGLLIFLLVPFNHSIHHYRDMPVVLASAAIWLLAAHFVRACATPPRLTADQSEPTANRPLHASPPPAPFFTASERNDQASREASRGNGKASRGRHLRITNSQFARDFLKVGAIVLLGIWSRIEVLAFVGVLLLGGLLVYRARALRLAISYAVAAAAVTATLLVVYRLEDVDLSQAWFYTAHTFLDSTPDSWLSAACQANPTENCREADGLGYFGPADLRAGVLALALNHPLTTLAKSARSAWDNLWVLFGPNLSTFPGVLPVLVLVLALVRPTREAYREVPAAVWIVVAALLAESVLPPLTWAPPHPQYHVQLVLAVTMLLVPLLTALLRMPRARLLALAFLAANAALSAFRYTRYAGY